MIVQPAMVLENAINIGTVLGRDGYLNGNGLETVFETPRPDKQ